MRFFLCLVFYFSASGFADERLLVLTEYQPPYSYERDGKLAGYSSELVHQMLQRSGLRFEHKLLPWKRAYSLLQKRKNTFLYSTVKTPARAPLFHWVGPLYPIDFNFYKLKRRQDISIDKLEDLHAYTIGVPEGDFGHHYLLEFGLEPSTVKALLDYDMVLPMMYRNHLDLNISPPLVFEYRIRSFPEYRLSDFETAFSLPSDKSFYIAVNKDTDTKIIKNLQALLDGLLAEGARARVLKRTRER